MSNEQLKYWYGKLKEKLIENQLDILVDDSRFESFCNIGDALTKVMEENNLAILSGVPTRQDTPAISFNTESSAIEFPLYNEADENKMQCGVIAISSRGVSIVFTNREKSMEAYNNLAYNGNYLVGDLAKIKGTELVVVNLDKDGYQINSDGNILPYASTVEAEKVQEVYNAINSRTR